MTVGRNDPCPCGSGRKYKKCCMLSERANTDQLAPRRINEASEEANDLLLKHARRTRGEGFVDDAWRAVLGEGIAPAQRDPFAPLILPWAVYLWDEGGASAERHGTVAAQFLQQPAARRLGDRARRFIEACRHEPLTFWHIEDVEPGAGMSMRDMATGRQCYVHERSATQTAVAWDIMFGQVVCVDDVHTLSMSGPYVLPALRFRQQVERFLADGVDADHLQNHAEDLLAFYVACVDELYNPVLPELRNTEGDPLEWTTSTYRFDTDARGRLLGRLDRMRNIEARPGEEDGVAEYGWVSQGDRGPAGQVSRARLRVEAERLVTECNSRKRDRLLRERLLKNLDDLLAHEETTHKPLDRESIEAADPTAAESAASDSGSLDMATLPPEARAQIQQTMDDIRMRWADEEVPALGGRTPRQAVRTEAGRREVVQLINDFENMERRAPNPQLTFDYNRLRRELGLEEERPATTSGILQIRVDLRGTQPGIWRRIQIAAQSTFWDLHVAIQDAMGWTDSHLHAFRVMDLETGQMRELGIPDDDGGLGIEPGWEHEVTDLLSVAQPRAVYEYDFGDSWEHDVVLEDVLPGDGGEYPRCVDGERACPPEDVGGVPGFEEFLAAITDPDAEEHDSCLEWVGGSFDAARFDPRAVPFQDPDERWEEVFGDEAAEADDGAGLAAAMRPQIEGGFTADEIASLMLDPFGDDSLLRLQTELPDEVYEAAPIVRDMGRFLRVVAAMAPLKLTPKGNLTKAALSELIAAAALGPAKWWEARKTPTEAEAPRGTLLRLLAEWTGMTRKQHGKLLLTKRGQAAAEGRMSKGELFGRLIERFAVDLNWAYADPLPTSAWLQRGFWYALYLLQEYGEQKRSCLTYAHKFLAAFPMTAMDFDGVPYGEAGELTGRAFQRRVVHEFAVELGMAQVEEAPGAQRGEPYLVWAGPLLNRVVSWERNATADTIGDAIGDATGDITEEAAAGGGVTVAGPWPPGGAPEPDEADIAEPTIEKALDAFLADQRRRLRGRQTLRKYEQIVALLQRHLNADGPEMLTDAERALFERLNEAGPGQRSYCQIFGPEKIAPRLDTFVGYFMIRKATASAELLRAAGTVSKKLLAWLEMAELLNDAEAAIELADPAATSRDAARGREAADLLMAAAARFADRVPELPDEDYVEFDHHTIARVEPGRLWLEVYGDDGVAVEAGPIRVPAEATQRLQAGWDISCGLGRIGGRWELVEVANVYPA